MQSWMNMTRFYPENVCFCENYCKRKFSKNRHFHIFSLNVGFCKRKCSIKSFATIIVRENFCESENVRENFQQTDIFAFFAYTVNVGLCERTWSIFSKIFGKRFVFLKKLKISRKQKCSRKWKKYLFVETLHITHICSYFHTLNIRIYLNI